VERSCEGERQRPVNVEKRKKSEEENWTSVEIKLVMKNVLDSFS
jgi:hypothetical protein